MRTFADYELIEQLQPGNHGTFYLARPPARLIGRHEVVALKILDRHATDNEFKRMAAELGVLLELDHPHLVEVVDSGHEDGRLFYAMRYYREGSLPLGPCRDVAAVATQVADAAEAAHALHEVGVAHRDIKPSNILIEGGRGHLSDLGVANYADAHFTTTGNSPVGTLAYADPRLIHGEPAGRASDVWSLGSTLHAAVTGASVLGDIPDEHLAGAIEYVLAAQAVVSPSCPPDIAAIVAKATHTDRGQRYLTAADMAADLRAAAASAAGPGTPPPPVPAPPPPVMAQPPPPGPAPVPGGGPLAPDVSTGPPLQVEGQQAVGPVAPYEQPVLVVGQMSVAGHFNHPHARVCWVSGEEKGSRGPWTPAQDARPPLGLFIFDDGRSYAVRANTVLGRQPDLDPRIRSGEAAPLSLEGELTMSRVHLYIELRDWSVFVTDLSANGTSIIPARTGIQRQLVHGEPSLIEHEDVLVVEKLRITFRSHHII